MDPVHRRFIKHSSAGTSYHGITSTVTKFNSLDADITPQLSSSYEKFALTDANCIGRVKVFIKILNIHSPTSLEFSILSSRLYDRTLDFFFKILNHFHLMILPKSERDCCRVSAPRLKESETIDSAAVVAVGWSNSETKGLKRIDIEAF